MAGSSSTTHDGVTAAHPLSSAPVGRVKRKVAPCSSLGMAQSWPPCASTMARLIQQPHAHATRLGGKKRLEQLLHLLSAQPDAGVFHADQHPAPALAVAS